MTRVRKERHFYLNAKPFRVGCRERLLVREHGGRGQTLVCDNALSLSSVDKAVLAIEKNILTRERRIN